MLSFLRLLACGTLAAWTVDVLVHMDLVRLIDRPGNLVGDPASFLWLLLAEVPVALPLALAALLLARALRGRVEARALLSGLLVAATVAGSGRIAWHLSGAPLLLLGAIGGMAGAAVAMGLGRLGPHRSWLATCVWCTVPSLVAGYASTTLAHRSRAGALLTVATLAFAVLLGRVRTAQLASLLAAAPSLAAVGLATFLCVRPLPPAAPGPLPVASDPRPSVFVIVLDTVRADHLQRYGYARNTMPALERWSEGATVFRRAVSPAGWTAPAHASLLSGQSVSGHGVHYSTGERFFTKPREDIQWLPPELARLGYRTAAVCANGLALKWGASGFHRAVIPGRGKWFDASLAAVVDDISPLTAPLSERVRWRMPYETAGRLVDTAIEVFEETPLPMFGLVNLLDAHSPYNPPRRALRELGLSPGRPAGLYRSQRDWSRMLEELPEGSLQDLIDLYDGELRGMDPHLERLLEWIERVPGPESVVIVTSDHGEELGEGGRVGHELGLSQALIHVPLLVRAGGMSPGPHDGLVNLTDLHDFVLSFARGRASGATGLGTDETRIALSERYGSSLNARWFGPEYAEPWVAMIRGDVKAMGPPPVRFQVHDVAAGGFAREVPLSDPVDEEAWRARLTEYWEESRDVREDAGAPSSREEREALRALGYVQ